MAFVGGIAAAPAAGQGLDQTCALSLTRLDHTTTNALALDTNAVYWVVGYTASPGARLRVEGQFPHARYIGFNVYDPAGRPKDAMSDIEIEPDPGAANPFPPGADRTGAERRYTLFVEFSEEPEEPAPNTLYSGDSPGGTFWYRVYIPDAGQDEKGGVPLPRVTLEPADSEGGAPGVEPCDELQAPYLQGVNDLIAALPGAPILGATAYPGRDPPNWRLFVNLGKAALDIMLDNESGEDFHDPAQDFTQEGAGYFANRDISYIFTATSRAHGQVLVLRGRAPTFPDTRPGPALMPSGKDMRYWSFCQYEPATQRVIACLADDHIPVDDRGFYTVVVSNAEHRPENARAECGFAWLAWGPATQGLVIYRHMLAERGFVGAINRIPEPGLEREILGDYYPEGRYVADAEGFEQAGCPTGAPGEGAGDREDDEARPVRDDGERESSGRRAAGGAAGDAPGVSARATDSGTLPFTGLSLMTMALAAAGLICLGRAVRPRGSPK